MSPISRIRSRSLSIALACVASTALVGACSAGDVTDDAAERVAEANGSGDVAVDSSEGRIEVSTDEGSIVAEAGGELPEGWPDDGPLPDEYTVESAARLDAGTGPVHTVIVRTSGEPIEVFEQIEGGFAGWTEASRTVSGSGFEAVVMVQYTKGDRTASVTASEGTDDTVVNYVVSAIVP
jgi:hypothetical protein